MVKCLCCGKMFDPDEAREEYDMEFEDMKYDDDYLDRCYCADCAIQESYEGLSAGATLLDLMGPGNAPWE